MGENDYKIYKIPVKDRFDQRDRTIVIVKTPYATRSYISSFVYGEEGGFLEFEEQNMNQLFGINPINIFDEYVARTKSSKDALLCIISNQFETCQLVSKELSGKINNAIELCD